MKLTRALFKGWGVNQFGCPEGIWVTEEQVNELVRRQYDPDRADKPMRMGGKWVIPKNFLGEDSQAGKRELKELMESSTTFGSDDIRGLAEAGYLDEIQKNLAGGWSKFVGELVASGKYQLPSGEQTSLKTPNNGQLEQMKKKLLESKKL